VSVSEHRVLSRVVLLYWPRNFAAAVASFCAALGIADLEGPIDPPGSGVRAMISLSRRIEFLTPHGEGAHRAGLEAHLAQRGEGLFTLAWSVANLAAAEATATAAGFGRQGDDIDLLVANPAWASRFDFLRETPIAPIAGVNVMLIEGRSAPPATASFEYRTARESKIT
jgi:hypothetical protein